MDFSTQLFIGIIVTIGTAIAIKLLGQQIGVALGIFGTVLVLGPLFIIYITGSYKLLNATPQESQQIASDTISALIKYVGEQLPSIVVDEIAGMIGGAILAMVMSIFHI